MKALRTTAACTAIVAALLTSTAAAAGANAPPSPRARAAATVALRELGVPYVWGGTSPATGFDDSGLVVWAFAHAGRPGLPHYAGDLWKRGTHVARSALQRGDLVFFDDAGHVGIYLGHGEFVHAPGTDRAVTIARLAGRYLHWYTGAVRIA